MQHRFVAVIGSRNSGKSTVIKSLTGCKSGQFRGWVKDVATGRSIGVIASSPQEKEMTLREMLSFMRQAKRTKNCNGVVCALQSSHPYRRVAFEDVLRAALKSGFEVHAFFLNPPRRGRQVALSALRSRLPPGVRSDTMLDGRRFAHANASCINAVSSIAS